MIGAVSLSPYVSGYQYTGNYSRTRSLTQDTQVQAEQRSAAVGQRAASTGRNGGATSLIGARSITAGQNAGVSVVSAGRGADPESPVPPVDAVSVLQPGSAGSTDYTIPFLRQGMDPAELSVRMRMQQYSEGEEAEGDRAAVSREASQTVLPGSSQGVGKEAVQPDLPGSSQAAEEGTVRLDLPGSSQGGGKEAVQPDLPGTASDVGEQMGLPAIETEKAAEAGLPGETSQSESVKDDDKKNTPDIAGLRTEDTGKTPEETECKTCKERKYQDGSNDPGVSFKTPTHIGPDQSAAAVRGHEMEHVVRERAKAQSEGRRVISQSVTMQTGICPECGRVYTAGGVTRTTTAAKTPEEIKQEPRWILAAAS